MAPIVRHALAETVAEYGGDTGRATHTKLSISLPTELYDEIRRAADESAVSVSAVIAAGLRRAIAAAEQERLDRALALDADDNEEWARAALELTARAWSELKW